ncbi:hypothetical protein [Microlunatus flavus]|uniref:Uncharacterized protein n=1 Tax=Microlunatus flavus TaxID=1036181 RepID=A0A1H9ALY2_9ACTN|nr:hypothetical protein [Microlunatus flavus]SEP77531.1 hypothetical protein SAMN05421756_101651 [Microlunatus flavus]
MQHAGDAVTFVVVLCLPVAVWLISRPWAWERIRPYARRFGLRIWGQLVVDEEPDPATLQRWAVERLGRLRTDLERVRRLLLDDEWMSATRQVGNRLAYERLVVDVRRAEAQVPAALVPDVAAAPTPVAAPRFAFVAPSGQPSVEVIEFGPAGRWL